MASTHDVVFVLLGSLDFMRVSGELLADRHALAISQGAPRGGGPLLRPNLSKKRPGGHLAPLYPPKRLQKSAPC